jgi:hypothetical protein
MGMLSAASDTEVPLNGLNLHLIPEPSTLAMLALPLLGFALYLWRRRRMPPPTAG